MAKVIVEKPFIYGRIMQVVGARLEVPGPTAERLERKGLARSPKVVLTGTSESKKGRRKKRSTD